MEIPSENSLAERHHPLLAGIEAGGTHYVCAVATAPGEPLLQTQFPTRSPSETIAQAIAFFREASVMHGPIRSMGIGTFGPVDLDSTSLGYGTILTSPKRDWTGYNLLRSIREGLRHDFPIALETDVNAAALGEAKYGAAQNHRNVAYITIGTGIGGGFLQNGVLLHGRMHPEIGHLPVPDLDLDFGKNTNICPFHRSCLEGRASGPAIQTRWDLPGPEIPDDHPAWELEAKYLALACVNLTATWSPDIILLGGGVSQKSGLIEKVRREFEIFSGAYWSLPPLELYIQRPRLDQQAGIVGSLELARQLCELSPKP